MSGVMSGGNLTVGTIRAAASALLTAYENGSPLVALSTTYPRATVVDAYRIQQEQVRVWTAAGDAVRGHKIGLASAAMQQQMGVAQPDYGHLTTSMFYREDQPIPASRFLQPRIEPEIAFVLKAPLRGPGVTIADARRAVAYVLPALEIVDSRIQDWQVTIVDTIADNASTGAVILGGDATALAESDLRTADCSLRLNGTTVERGTGAAVLGSPLNALVWLANTIGLLGVALEPGHVVMSGSMTRAVPIARGDRVTATIAGMGSVTAVLG
ncbi:2-keto-4-pentenoate hydratase [Nonomuraea mangrovi]|uniref:2-keto-4-pentenoate hydratase n=1 Tax=Nonomuraea mangrovi TaxID=2316207 RepID=A0ABW4SUP2_9ACTN